MNPKTSIQPLTSMQKEMKEKEFFEFMEKKNGYEKIIKVLEPWDTGSFAFELFNEDNLAYCFLKINSITPSNKKEQRQLNKEKRQLEDKSMLIPNFDSPFLFNNYINFIKNQQYLIDDGNEYNEKVESIKMLSAIFKIIYNSKDKESEIYYIDKFLDHIDDYYKINFDASHQLRFDGNLAELKEEIMLFINHDKNYSLLAEATFRIYDIFDEEKKEIIKKLSKP